MTASAFLPRSRSKIVFVLAMVSYSLAAAALISTVATAFGAPRPSPGVFLERGYPLLQAIVLVIFAPVVESLILIGIIELLRWLRSPVWLQIAFPTALFAFTHLPISRSLVVAPGWFIMAAAYLMWRRVSWKVGFVVIASIHALLNLNSAISAISYAVRHTNA